MHDFDFLSPRTLDEAAQTLAAHGEDSRVIAGGTALMLALRQRLLAPGCLISLAGVEAMKGVQWDPVHGLRIGALTLHSEVAGSELVARHYPMLAGLARRMANPQVRNQGTLGGNLCYADPATDPPTGLLALDASVTLHSVRGTRVLPLAGFLVDYYTTALEPDELLVDVVIPPPGRFGLGRYHRFLKTPAEHRPLVTVAASAHCEGGVCHGLRLAVGASTPVPARLPGAEAHLAGQVVDAGRIRAAAAMAAEEMEALDDARGKEAYRRRMAEVAVRRTLADMFGIESETGGGA